MAKTKIVCTIGPLENEEKVKNLIAGGMDVARLNGSYFFGEEDNFRKRIKIIKQINDSIPVLLDLPGPKIRTKMKEVLSLKKGDIVGFYFENHGAEEDVPKIEVTGPLDHAGVGDIVLVDDGNLEFKVVGIKERLFLCEIINEGKLIHGKGVNFPDKDLIGQYLKKRDEKLIQFAKEMNLDFVGASFVRTCEDVRKLRDEIRGTDIKIISKIETKAALKNLEDIIDESDGIMIDRGDLSAETKMEHLPIIQKDIIKKSNKQGKPIIIATELLHNMINNAKPTKAEISDIANAVLDGASALMLSGETAVGTRPSESLKTMKSIVENTEELLDYKMFDYQLDVKEISNAISKSVYNLSNQLQTTKILCFTKRGYTPKMISRFKPSIPIIAITDSKNVQRELRIVWGVVPVFSKEYSEDMETVIKELLEKKVLVKDELVIVTKAEKIKGSINLNSITVKEI